MTDYFLKSALTVVVLLTGCRSTSADCPKFHAGHKTGIIELPLITEASGLAASRKNINVLWTHNDDGPACVYAITAQGKYLGKYTLDGARNRDWEDIAIGPGPEPNIDYLYVGDIGDNKDSHKYITIYRAPEPTVEANQIPANFTLSEVEAIELIYPDGPRNAETLMIDPMTKDLYIVTKEEPGRVYRVAYPQSGFVKTTPGKSTKSATDKTTLEKVAKLPWGTATGGDISPDGQMIIVRNYFSAYLWLRPKEGPLWRCFDGNECKVPLIFEPQGEAICFDANGLGYFTTSEHKNQPIYYFPMDRPNKK